MLKVTQLSAHYGGIHALQGIELEVPDGSIVIPKFPSASVANVQANWMATRFFPNS